MIKKALIRALLLLLAYEAIVRFCNIDWDTAQNDQSSNIISAQNFIYNLDDETIQKDTILVGSSITKKIPSAKLGENYINLAFNGWSAYDGLALITETGKIPACILIEENIVGETILAEGIRNSLLKTTTFSSKTLKSLQLKHQPVGLLIGRIKAQMTTKIKQLKALKRNNQEAYDANVERNRRVQQVPLSDSIYTQRFTRLKSIINHLQQEGTSIFFYEVPMDSGLTHTPMRKKQRKLFLSYFPKEKYHHIRLPQSNKFQYSDGTHLTEQSAVNFSGYLLEELKNTLN